MVKKLVADNIPLKELIESYNELNSSYRVAEKYKVSATAVKRILKKSGVLRTQNVAAKVRNDTYDNYKKGGRKVSDDSKKLMSQKAKERKTPHGMKGKTHTVEVRKRLSDSAKQRTGKRNPNYKHGTYQRRPKDYKIHEFIKIRNFVFNRDNYRCQYCSSNGYLHAHHMIPYWVCEKAYFDVDNIITVCRDCHFQKAHKNNWHKFDTTIISDTLLTKYNINRERLNDLGDAKDITCDSPSSSNI